PKARTPVNEAPTAAYAAEPARQAQAGRAVPDAAGDTAPSVAADPAIARARSDAPPATGQRAPLPSGDEPADEPTHVMRSSQSRSSTGATALSSVGVNDDDEDDVSPTSVLRRPRPERQVPRPSSQRPLSERLRERLLALRGTSSAPAKPPSIP